jgi:hypothetical protein
MKRLFFIAACCLSLAVFGSANGYEYRHGQSTVRLSAAGSAGIMSGGVFADYLLRVQSSKNMRDGWSWGFVYSIDDPAMDAGYTKDMFAYVETKYGRIEAGWTESVASKLALVLPDVGGLRLNNAPLFLPDGYAGITNPAIRGNQYAFRVNLATLPSNPWQLGVGQTIYAPEFDSSTDVGIRYRNPNGRTKTSLSLGFSYIANPRGMIGDNFLRPVYADARYQGTIGANIQWGSLIWAATFKAVVDDDPAGFISDGIQAGTGLSYEFLSWSAGADYVFSDIGVWRAGKNIAAHTGILSARYKITKYFSLTGSMGVVVAEGMDPDFFMAAGIGINF